jgi:hypothetical protein
VRVGLALDEAQQAVAGTEIPLPALARFLDLALQQHIPPAELETIIPTREQAPIPGTEGPPGRTPTSPGIRSGGAPVSLHIMCLRPHRHPPRPRGAHHSVNRSAASSNAAATASASQPWRTASRSAR